MSVEGRVKYRVFDADQVHARLDFPGCIAAVREAVSQFTASSKAQPLRSAFEVSPGSPDAPYDIGVPGAVYDADFMVKDSKRFADGGGWGYAVFEHNVASGMCAPATLTHKPPQGNDAKCGLACH